LANWRNPKVKEGSNNRDKRVDRLGRKKRFLRQATFRATEAQEKPATEGEERESAVENLATRKRKGLLTAIEKIVSSLNS